MNGRTRLLRLAAWLLVVVSLGVVVIGPATGTRAAAFSYDGVSTPSAGAHEFGAVDSWPAQLIGAREESASLSDQAQGASTTFSGAVVATEAAASAGSTGSTVAGNLTEQLAMEEVVSSPAGQQLTRVVMSEPRWPAADGWVKMSQNVNGVEIHYVFNTVTKAVDDFKFIGGGG